MHKKKIAITRFVVELLAHLMAFDFLVELSLNPFRWKGIFFLSYLPLRDSFIVSFHILGLHLELGYFSPDATAHGIYHSVFDSLSASLAARGLDAHEEGWGDLEPKNCQDFDPRNYE